MNHEKQPEALRLADQLATTYTVRDRWNASHHLRYLYGRVQELEAELVKEAARTAEEKLRADQMSQQHSTQAALNSEARKELAEIKLAATQPAAQAVPVLYVSKGQLDNHRDPDGVDTDGAGRYLPARKTPKGNFTAPLYERPAPAAQGLDATKLLAEKHTGMKVDYRGLLGQVRRAIKRTAGGHEEMLRQLEGHITELGQRWYAGDTAVVDELLQLYCVERQARADLAAQAKQGV